MTYAVTRCAQTTEETMKVLEALTISDATRHARALDLLIDPDRGSPSHWHMFVPACFADALDIKLTTRTISKKSINVWTQGSRFYFQIGYTLYDKPAAYQRWDIALKEINVCVQIKESTPAAPSTKINKRDMGYVVFDIMKPSKSANRLIVSSREVASQDDFVKLLILGPQD